MTKLKKILLASHGTAGARAAERAALAASAPEATIVHLYVVPDFWRGMMGDDWLNNASTRDRFARYVEDTLQEDMREDLERVGRLVIENGHHYEHRVAVGKPTACLIAALAAESFELAVIGARRPKGRTGYRSSIDLVKLSRATRVPVLIAPYPDDAGH